MEAELQTIRTLPLPGRGDDARMRRIRVRGRRNDLSEAENNECRRDGGRTPLPASIHRNDVLLEKEMQSPSQLLARRCGTLHVAPGATLTITEEGRDGGPGTLPQRPSDGTPNL